MGEKGSEEQLLGFLNAVLGRTGDKTLESVEIFEDRAITPDILGNKASVLDVRARTGDGTKTNIEVQSLPENSDNDCTSMLMTFPLLVLTFTSRIPCLSPSFSGFKEVSRNSNSYSSWGSSTNEERRAMIKLLLRWSPKRSLNTQSLVGGKISGLMVLSLTQAQGK